MSQRSMKQKNLVRRIWPQSTIIYWKGNCNTIKFQGIIHVLHIYTTCSPTSPSDPLKEVVEKLSNALCIYILRTGSLVPTKQIKPDALKHCPFLWLKHMKIFNLQISLMHSSSKSCICSPLYTKSRPNSPIQFYNCEI